MVFYFQIPRFEHATDYFTQVVWGVSREVGCVRILCHEFSLLSEMAVD